MQLYKVRQRLGAAPPDPRILDLQPVETPFKKSWVRPCAPYKSTFSSLFYIVYRSVNNRP